MYLHLFIFVWVYLLLLNRRTKVDICYQCQCSIWQSLYHLHFCPPYYNSQPFGKSQRVLVPIKVSTGYCAVKSGAFLHFFLHGLQTKWFCANKFVCVCIYSICACIKMLWYVLVLIGLVEVKISVRKYYIIKSHVICLVYKQTYQNNEIDGITRNWVIWDLNIFPRSKMMNQSKSTIFPGLKRNEFSINWRTHNWTCCDCGQEWLAHSGWVESPFILIKLWQYCVWVAGHCSLSKISFTV